MLSKREIVSFWCGYIVMMRNKNINMGVNGKYNDVVMEELIKDLCKLYGVDESMIDDMDYEYDKHIPLKLIMKKINID
jgi:Mg-chelatase subunit ChlI